MRLAEALEVLKDLLFGEASLVEALSDLISQLEEELALLGGVWEKEPSDLAPVEHKDGLFGAEHSRGLVAKLAHTSNSHSKVTQRYHSSRSSRRQGEAVGIRLRSN
jgi:hypothetical protein